ncbi:MAG: type IV pili system adhesin PilY [marine bacterium B5-7]|nr:MAG: type IV pili system adhesin PilY [marine bacterium B5-7]
MNRNRPTRVAVALISAISMVLFSHASMATDTEIYKSINTVNPNLLFILDTSGSMAGNVVVSTYEYQTDYSSLGNCDPDFYYWSDDSSDPPDCDTTDQKIPKAEFACNAGLESINGSTGFYTDDFMGWYTGGTDDRWRDADVRNNSDDLVNLDYYECLSDWGEYGALDNSTAKWPVNGDNGPWQTTQPSNRNIWDSNSRPSLTIFSANYINWDANTVKNKTRLKVVQDVTTGLVNSLENINIGLMRLNFENGGPVVYPITDVDEDGVKTDFLEIVNGWSPDGWTPITETLSEAKRYYRGESVYWGTSDNGGASTSSAIDDGSYISPITETCQENNILVLTDGLPTKDSGADSDIHGWLEAAGLGDSDSCAHVTGSGEAGIESCLDDLAEYLHKTDNSDLDGVQAINTYSVGFTTDNTLLSATGSEKTGGKYFTANNEGELQASFKKVIEEILASNATFTSPTFTANLFNRVVHNNNIYYAMFKPNTTASWNGNVKKYQIGFITDGAGNKIDADNNGEDDVGILDVDGKVAVTSSGEFKSTAKSFFTHSTVGADGNEPTKGGLASRLNAFESNAFNPASRAQSVYTYTQADADSPIKDLNNSVNKLLGNNSLITQDFLGITPPIGNDAFQNMIKWAQGYDVKDENGNNSTTDARSLMGAPLHSEPVVVTYQRKTINGVDKQRDIVFITTNDGFLHAFDTLTDNGNNRLELWSYIPPQTLKNLKTVYENADSDDISYGLDGNMDLWINDVDNDGNILGDNDLTETGEHVYLYFNQRRGGRNVFAVDVSQPNAPKYLWTLEGSSSTSSKLYSLGQTWSRPKFARIRIKDTSSGDAKLVTREVIIFGGGYDIDQDDKTTREDDDVGNAVYIADAETGEILWWTRGPSSGPTPDNAQADMKYSIPGDIRVIDITSDGVADRLYFVDMGGQLWRFDINNVLVDTLAKRIIGGVVADLQLDTSETTSTAANFRRFFYPPDIALIEPDIGDPFLSMAIGSGVRSNPKSTAVTDRIYVIKDHAVTTPPLKSDGTVGYTKVYAGDLLNVTNNVSPDISDPESSTSVALEKGWYITLEGTGEKSLSTAITAEGNVFFTTYTPAATVNDNDACGADGLGKSRVYALNVINGAPIADLNKSGGGAFTKADRSLQLQREGIASNVSIIFPNLEGITPKVLVGTEIIPVELENDIVRTYWFQDNVH